MRLATEAASQMASTPSREHYHAGTALDRAVENMFHLVECRNIMLWIMESIEAMEIASYCGDAISMLVIDKSDNNVAKLLPVRCNKIKQLASAFENCLSELIIIDRPAALVALVHTDMSFANKVTVACQEALSELGLEVPVPHCTELWRCAVHVLDMAVLSYAGAHTQPFGNSVVKLLTLPGPFLENQYFMFRRRSFHGNTPHQILKTPYPTEKLKFSVIGFRTKMPGRQKTLLRHLRRHYIRKIPSLLELARNCSITQTAIYQDMNTNSA